MHWLFTLARSMMKQARFLRICGILFFVLVGLCVSTTRSLSQSAHPRALFDSTDVEGLSQGINGNTWQSMVEDAAAYPHPKQNFSAESPSYAERLLTLGLISLVDSTVTLSDGVTPVMTLFLQYFDVMRSYAEWNDRPTPLREDLNISAYLLSLALAYDWHYDRLGSERREATADLLLEAATYWETASPWLVKQEDLDGSGKVLWERGGMFIGNHAFRNCAGIATAAFVLAGDRDTQALIDRMEEIRGIMIANLPSDGADQEGASYHSTTKKHFLIWNEIRDRFFGTGTLQDIPWLNESVMFDLYSFLPGGTDNFGGVVLFGDASNRPKVPFFGIEGRLGNSALSNAPVAQWMSQEMDDEERDWLAYLWCDPDAPAVSREQVPTWHHFEKRGEFVWRSSWEDSAIHFSMRSGSSLGGHDHPDNGSFNIFKAGVPYLTDYGVSRCFRTDDHNLIVVNGTGQLGEMQGGDPGGQPVNPVNWATMPFVLADESYFDVVADPTSMYRDASLISWQREIIGFGIGMFIMWDQITGTQNITVDNLLHSIKTEAYDGQDADMQYQPSFPYDANPWSSSGTREFSVDPRSGAEQLYVTDVSTVPWNSFIETSQYLPKKLPDGSENEVPGCVPGALVTLGGRLRRANTGQAMSSLVAIRFGDYTTVSVGGTEGDGVRITAGGDGDDVGLLVWPKTEELATVDRLQIAGQMGGRGSDSLEYFGRGVKSLAEISGVSYVISNQPVSMHVRHGTEPGDSGFVLLQTVAANTTVNLFCPDQPDALLLDGIPYSGSYSWTGGQLAFENIPAGEYHFVLQYSAIVALPDTTVAVSPPDSALVLADSASFIWHAGSPEVDRYWFQIDTSETFLTAFIDSSLTDTSLVRGSLINGERYYWTVRAHNISDWGPFAQVRTFTVDIPLPRPATPVLLDPPDSSTDLPTSVTLQWMKQEDSTGFSLQFGTDSTFASLLVEDSTLVDTSYALDSLENATTYYWRISAHNISGESGWSARFGFSTIVALPDTVVAINPADSALVQTDSAFFVWMAASPQVDRYWFQIDTSEAFLAAVIDSSLADTSYTQESLVDGMRYYWTVRAHNNAGWGPFAPVKTFMVDIPPPPPATPVLLDPPDGATDLPTSVTLQWLKQADSTGYHLQFGADSTLVLLLVEDSTLVDTSYALDSLEHDTWYYWRISAHNGLGPGQWSMRHSFRTIVDLPDTVVVVSPADSALVLADSASFFWKTGSPEVDRYWFQIDTLESFPIAFVDSSLTDTSVVHGPLIDGERYYWTVRAHNNAGWGPFAPVRTFAVTIPPPPPVLLDPLDGVTDLPTSVTLTWMKQGDSTGYRLQLGTDSTFALLLLEDSALVDTSYALDSLENGTMYYWRVSAHNITGTSGWSERFRFRTIADLPDTVVAFSPEDSALVQADSTSFVWGTTSPEVDRYWFQIDTSESFPTAFVDSSLTDTSVVHGLLIDAERYSWTVRAHNNAGWGPFALVRTFTVDIPPSPPATPVPLDPPDGAADLPTSLVVTWMNGAGSARHGRNGPAEELIMPGKHGSGTKGAMKKHLSGDNPLESMGIDSVTYHLQFSADSTISAVLVEDSTLVDTSYALDSLEHGTTYYWRVSAHNITGTSGWSARFSFRTIVAPPDTVVAISPADSALVQADFSSFIWNAASPEVDRYWFQIDTSETFLTAFVDSSLTDTSVVHVALVNGKRYYWTVSAHNNAGWGPFAQVRTFTIDIPPPPPATPVLVDPPDGAVDLPASVALIWTGGDAAARQRGRYPVHETRIKDRKRVGAGKRLRIDEGLESMGLDSVTYHLQLSADSTLSTFLVNDSTLADTTYQIDSLAGSTTFYWRVRVMSETESSLWSDPWSFSTLMASTPPPIPCEVLSTFLVRCQPVGRIQMRLTLLNSTQYAGEIISFQVDTTLINVTLETNGTHSRAQAILRGQTTGQHIVSLANLPGCFDPVTVNCSQSARAGDDWLWEDGFEWGGELSLLGDLPEENQLMDNFPNPFNPATTIRYALKDDSQVSLDVYDLLGRKVKTIVDEYQTAGYKSVEWRGDSDIGTSLASGIYFYTLRVRGEDGNQFMETRRMMLMK